MSINGETAAVVIDAHRHELSEEIVSRQYRLEPEIWDRFGDRGREYSLRDQAFHLQYLSEAMLGVSVTMTFHTHLLAELIAAVRAAVDRPIKILVGGYPFNIAPELWRKVEADGFAPDAQSAVATANRIVDTESANEPG
jgi:hypothetical protein